jgi:benzodiazapine receptor
MAPFRLCAPHQTIPQYQTDLRQFYHSPKLFTRKSFLQHKCRGWQNELVGKTASKIVKLAASIALCQMAGLIGSLFTFPAIPTWYAHLNKPFFSPPNWVFGPVWTILYILMGISFFIIWSSKAKKSVKKYAVILFLIQLGLNSLWSLIFFGLKNPFLALIEIGVLWLMIYETIIKFAKINQAASRLLCPYLAWVSFASLLNLSVWLLN